MSILLSWTWVGLWPSWIAVCAAILVVGNRYYALFIIGHDGLHRNLFRSRWANDLFADCLILAPIGAITRLNNSNHLNHHHSLATADDPDRHRYTCLNKATLPMLLFFLAGTLSACRSVYDVFVRRPTAAQGASGRYRFRDFVILVGWQTALMAGLSLGIGWWAYLVLWLLPTYVFTFVADNLRTFLEHAQIEPDREADQHRLITYRSNPLERCLLAPMHMNLHAAHHLWPSIPYYNLSQADRELQRLAVGGELEWRSSYLGFLWRYARALPLHDCLSAASGLLSSGRAPVEV
jgi:fatty acid desaturase